MIITTKFNLKQTVWFMHENKVVSAEIERVHTNTSPFGHDIQYCLRFPANQDSVWLTQEKLFETKQELLNSL